MVNAGILSCHLDLRRFSSLLLGGNTREIRPSCRREVERVRREVERVRREVERVRREVERVGREVERVGGRYR
jgi:archaellum component FlaC